MSTRKALIKVYLIFTPILFLLSNVTSAKPLEFQLFVGTETCKGCLIIEANGTFTSTSHLEFSEFLKENPDTANKDTTIVFNSNGGSLAEALKIGRLIRYYQFNTHIASIKMHSNHYVLKHGLCASACAYAFLDGNKRSMEINSKFGVHQISVQSNDNVNIGKAIESTQEILASISKYLDDMGVSSQLLILATTTNKNTIKWINDSQLASFNVINTNGLTKQKPWRAVTKFNHTWSIFSLLPNGSNDLVLLGCKKYSTHLNLSLSHSKRLPKNHSLSGSYIQTTISIFIEDQHIINNEKVTIFFSNNQLSVSTKILADILDKSISTNKELKIILNYPDTFLQSYFPAYHLIPLNGLKKAFISFKKECPKLY